MSDRFNQMELDLTPEEIAAWHAKRAAQTASPAVAAPKVEEEVLASPCLPMKAPVQAPKFPAYRDLGDSDRKTAHGATMSSRMHRFYRWCDDYGMGLSDWSTDTMVQKSLPKLQLQLEVEKAHLAMLEGGSMEEAIQGQLVRDIESIMQRVPENRSQTVQEAKAEAKKSFRNELIAVAESSEVTGGVIYWQLTGDVNRDDLAKAWAEQGLDEADLPELATPEVALGRAAKELQSRQVLIRKHPKNGWAIVRESAAGENLDYKVIVRVFMKGAKGAEEIAYEAMTGHEGEAQLEFDRVVAEYNKARASLNVIDMSAWLVRMANKLNGVPLRDRGGIYFVPRAGIETVRKVKAALAVKSGCLIHEIPAMHSAEAISAIFDAVSMDAAKFISDVEGELAGDMGARAAKNRITEVEGLLKKVRSYEGLLGKQFGDVADKISDVIKRLDKVTTRAAQLEVD